MGALILFLVLPAWLPAGPVSVFLPDGSPASGATANSVRTALYLEVRNGVAVNRYGKPHPELAADGKFLVPDAELGRFVFLHAQGWADEDVGAETPGNPAPALERVSRAGCAVGRRDLQGDLLPNGETRRHRGGSRGGLLDERRNRPAGS